MIDEKVLKNIIRNVILEEFPKKELSVSIGVSSRHVHLSKEDKDILFGHDYELGKLRNLKQPGQYAAKETVKIGTEKNSFDRVRVLGPLRNETQIEISLTDSRFLGLDVPIRESGKLENTPSITLIGPKGIVEKKQGVIAPLRHIHMPENMADLYGFKDGEMVDIELGSLRKSILTNVLIRVSKNYVLECHIDTDEGNSSNVGNNHVAKILRSRMINNGL